MTFHLILRVLEALRLGLPSEESIAGLRAMGFTTILVHHPAGEDGRRRSARSQARALDEAARHSLDVLALSGYVVGAGLLIGTCILLGLFRYQERFVELFTRPISWIKASWRQPTTNFFNHFLDGLRVLQRPRDLLITTAASLLMWYVICWQVRFTLLAFDVDLPLRAAYLIVTMAVIGLAVPTPGGVGGFHKATQVGMTLFFGIGLNEATGIAIAYHAICFVPITIIGLLCVPLLGVNLRDVDSVGSEAAEE